MTHHPGYLNSLWIQSEKPDCHTISSLIQTILSVPESHQISHLRGSRTLPPVGNHTPPRRTYRYVIPRFEKIYNHFTGISDINMQNNFSKAFVSSHIFSFKSCKISCKMPCKSIMQDLAVCSSSASAFLRAQN